MNQHVVATPIPRNNSVDATNYNAPQVSKDYIVQQQADWAQPRRVMKPLPGRLPASNRAMKRYIRCNVSIYEHFGLYNSCSDCKASTGSLVRPPRLSVSSLLQETCRRLLIACGVTICDVQLDDFPSCLMHPGSIQYIPLKTGFVRQMLAPYSSYSAFVWQAWLKRRVDIIS